MTMDAATWVDLAPLVDPMKTWLRTETGKTVSFAQAPGADPSKATPPFSVLSIVSDPRIILTMDGGMPAEVTWQLDYMGETAVQALALADKGARAMCLTDPPAFPAATVISREPVGDAHGPDRIGPGRFLVQARYRWTFIGAVFPDTP